MAHNEIFTGRVQETFPESADRILAIIRVNREHALMYAGAYRRDKESYYPHDTYVLKLEALNDVLGTHGVEYIPAGRGSRSPAMEYLNTGDLYNTTIVYFPERQIWLVTCVGDLIERGNYD